jgi:hypothetical protein
MQVDKAPFPIHTVDLQHAKVLVRPSQAETTKGKAVIIGDERPQNLKGTNLTKEVVLEKAPDGRESVKVTLKPFGHVGQTSSEQAADVLVQEKSEVRVSVTRSSGFGHGRPRMIKPKRPKVGIWKVNQAKVQGRFTKPKPTFDKLFDKYVKQRAVSEDRPSKKRARSPPQHVHHMYCPLRSMHDQDGMGTHYGSMQFPRYQHGWMEQRGFAFDRLSLPMHDRLGPDQSSYKGETQRFKVQRLNDLTSRKRSPPLVKQVYRVRRKDEDVQPMNVDPERTTSNDII